MAEKTSNYNLEKQQLNDYINIEGINENFDIIDDQIKNVSDKADQAFQSASDGKGKIKTAITGIDTSVTIPTDATFAQLATAIGQIKTGVDTGDATATAEQILAGMTAYVKGAKITGTIPSKTAATYTPGIADQTIAAGQYLSGAQTIKGDANLVSDNIKAGTSIYGKSGKSTVVDTADAALDPTYLLTGYSGYDDGVKKAGTMPNRDRAWNTPVMAVPQQGVLFVVPPDGWYAGSTDWSNRGGVRLGDSNFVSSNILSTASIFGLQGSAIAGKRWASGSGKTSDTTIQFTEYSGQSVYSTWADGMGLTFQPSYIIVLSLDLHTYPGNITGFTIYMATGLPGFIDAKVLALNYTIANWNNMHGAAYKLGGDIYVTNGSFKLPHWTMNADYTWIAYE